MSRKVYSDYCKIYRPIDADENVSGEDHYELLHTCTCKLVPISADDASHGDYAINEAAYKVYLRPSSLIETDCEIEVKGKRNKRLHITKIEENEVDKEMILRCKEDSYGIRYST
ncbi:hypothetical protein KS4_18140 [Poriferisphaera corsica]|uniref:Uncharacterized protein n=1 Tax=Poriferisphaera corsica TaxID=2528020 RepID=A0A517YU66_9BACT|nr:hypothetical protein [Poriferisphaera corsica]QDU33757.1 hypothetical protein KS4_18140 [Poriferisphaera corsica]